MTEAGRCRGPHLTIAPLGLGAWLTVMAEFLVVFCLVAGVLRAETQDTTTAEDMRVFLGDVMAACTTSDQEHCLHLVEEILERSDIKDKRLSWNSRVYNAEALLLNMVSTIYLDLGRFDEAEAALRHVISKHSEERIFSPLWLSKDRCASKAGPAALQRLYYLYVGEYGEEKVNQPLAQETGHELIRRYPEARMSCDGWWEFVDCDVAKEMLTSAKSEGREVFLREAERILHESENPFCEIGVLDALARMKLQEHDYAGAIELYEPIVEQYSDYVVDRNPFHSDYYRFSSPSYAPLVALEEIGMIYLYRIKDVEKASATFSRAARICEEIASKKPTLGGHRMEEKAEKYRSVAESRFMPEYPIVEGRQVRDLAWHPNGRTIAYIVHRGGIYEKDIDEEGDGDLIIEQAEDHVHYTSDGRRLIYMAHGDIWFYDREERAERRITAIYKRAEGGKMFQARVSPGDSLVIFNRIGKLHLLDLRTGEMRSLGYSIFSPCWSPDGQSVIGVYRAREVQLDIATGELREYVTSETVPTSFSLDGKYSVCKRKIHMGLAIVSRDGVVTELPHWYHRYAGSYAKWSPDGRHIAYVMEGNKIFIATVPQEFR